MKKVFLTQPIHEKGMQILKKEMEVIEASEETVETIKKEIEDCEAVITRISKITGDIIRNTPGLKIIAKHGVGLDKIDVDVATEHNIPVINTPNANVIAVAEHTVTMILALAKNLVKMDRAVREDKFEMRDQVVNMEIKGKAIGIIGLGSIGISIAKMLKGFDVEILAYDPYINNSDISDTEIKLVDNIDEIYLRSDIISLHVPLNKSTRAMIGKKEFTKMKDDVLFINAARGGVVKEKELYDALVNNEIGGAGLDVTEPEPLPENSKLWELDNVIITPHTSGFSPTNKQRQFKIFKDNLNRYLNQEELLNLIDFDLKY